MSNYKYNYVYRITNIIECKHYYGCRSTNILPSEDIGKRYFSSSHNKDFIKDQKENPSNYKYKIIKVYETRQQAIELEIKLHDKFNVGVNESFYNKAKQNNRKFDTTGIKFTFSNEHREKLSKVQIGKIVSEETRRKIGLTSKGRKHSEETKRKIGRSGTGKKHTEETKRKISESNKGKAGTFVGKTHSEETKRKMRKPKKKQLKTTKNRNL
jgi:hypothetical protein